MAVRRRWFRTADVGFTDADGDLHLVDRSSDLVIVNGFNVYPREVEQVLLELPGVAEAAVVGVPDERSGQAVRALLVSAPGVEPTVDEVRAHCVGQLARFKVPALIEFVPALRARRPQGSRRHWPGDRRDRAAVTVYTRADCRCARRPRPRWPGSGRALSPLATVLHRHRPRLGPSSGDRVPVSMVDGSEHGFGRANPAPRRDLTPRR